MATVSHGSPPYSQERPAWLEILKGVDVWASLAITVMWLAVLFDSIFGPDFVTTSTSGDTTRIPSGIVIALFAFLGSSAVARYAFRDRR